MPLDKISRLLEHLSHFDFAQDPQSGDEGFWFIWHGGEPFMVPIEQYTEIGKLQKSIIGPLRSRNFIQTNLTILTDRHIEWLKSGKFIDRYGLGFSFDVYGDQRIDIRSRPTADKVLDNLQRVLDNDIPISGIVVLSRSTISQLRNIFHFYHGIGMDFRLLPYHIESEPQQTAVHSLEPQETAAAMCTLFDLWCQAEESIIIAPLNEYTEDAIAFINNRKKFFYDKAVDESIFVVNTDGAVHGHETYLNDHRYGNLFEQPFEEILCSDNRRRLVAKAAQRVEEHCFKCEFYGACSGFPVAEANPMEQRWLARSGCYVAKVLTHIVERLSKAGLGLLPDAGPSTSSPLRATRI